MLRNTLHGLVCECRRQVYLGHDAEVIGVVLLWGVGVVEVLDGVA